MSDLVSMAQPLLDLERLLRPIPGDNPSGVLLRNEEVYDSIRDALKPGDRQGTDLRVVLRDAGKVLESRSKDLDVAVWMVEALVRSQGLSALPDGLLLIKELLERFWDTIYPLIDADGDEGFRAKPLLRLNTVFVASLRLIVISNDPRRAVQFTMYQYDASRGVPREAKVSNSAELARKREWELKSGTPPPEEVDKAIDGTPREFYLGLAEDAKRAHEALEELRSECAQKFRTRERPDFDGLANLLVGFLNTIGELLAAKPVAKPAVAPQPVAAAKATAETVPEAQSPAAPVESAPEPPPVPVSIATIAAELRKQDSSDPVPYLLLRAWRFGPILAGGSPVDESRLEPPPTQIRTALRKAWRDQNWAEVLDITEAAMEQPCGSCWLDLHHRAYRAAKELDRNGVALGLRAITAGYLQAMPEIVHALMQDGSPVADAETQIWLRGDLLADRRPASQESPKENGGFDFEEHAAVFDGKEPDALEVAESELQSGRFAEAFRVLSEAVSREQSGRGRMLRKVQLAKICVDARQYRLALPFLREVCRMIDEQRLETWEPADFVAAPLGMLYRTLDALGEGAEERQRVYERLCLVNPMRALELAAL